MITAAGMVEGHEAEAKPEAVASARAEFVQSLSRRLEFVRNLLESLGNAPDAGERQASAQRRLHALKAAAQVLAFDGLAEALAEIEAKVSGPLSPEAGLALARRLELLPSLVLSPSGSGQFRAVSTKPGEYPLHALVFGSPPLADSLRSELAFATGHALECVNTESLSRARSVALEQAPDVILIDHDRPQAAELLTELLSGDYEAPPIVVVGQFDSPEAASGLAKLGVTRVLPKPVSPSTLRATVLDVYGRRARRPEPVRGYGELTVEKLAERVASELEEGLKGTVESGTSGRSFNLGDGAEVMAAVWGAVARIREVVTVRSGGQVRFDPRGPEGAIHVAPWASAERRAGERAPGGARSADDVTLEGRLVLVADDDPAVTWFISGLLRSAGAQVMEAHDGKQALELCQRYWPDAVVSDILMPELDGFKLCREVKGDIAVRDVPVILLSWKEDMLQRVRELGAGADGYLKKEADGSLIVQRLREVMRPRSRIESRLVSGAEVKGRLGDITPRLVLQLACQRMPNSQVSIRDAAYLYEVEIRRGKPVAASRTAEDGTSARGRQVISSLLGVSAGRFAVRPSESDVQRDFEHDLFAVLEEPIRLARGARSALGGGRLFEVAQVALDPAVMDAYMRATPESAREVARKIAQGVAVRQLVKQGVEVGLIEAVLLDLAQHGGVRAIVTVTDGDILPRAAELMADVTATGEPPPVHELAEPLQFTLKIESSALPPEVDTAPEPSSAAPPVRQLAVEPPDASEVSADVEPALSVQDREEIEGLLLGLSEHPPSAQAPAVQEAAEVAAEQADSLRGSTSEESAGDSALPQVRPLTFGVATVAAPASAEVEGDGGWDEPEASASKAPAVAEPLSSVEPPRVAEQSSAASPESALGVAELDAPVARLEGDSSTADSSELASPVAVTEAELASPVAPVVVSQAQAPALLTPTQTSPPVVPRPVLELGGAHGTQPIEATVSGADGGSVESVSVENQRGDEVERAQGQTAPLPPVNSDDVVKSLKSELLTGLERRAPIDGTSPVTKTIVMPKASTRAGETAPLPPTKPVVMPTLASATAPAEAAVLAQVAAPAQAATQPASVVSPASAPAVPEQASEAPAVAPQAADAGGVEPAASSAAPEADQKPAASVPPGTGLNTAAPASATGPTPPEEPSASVPVARPVAVAATQRGLGPVPKRAEAEAAGLLRPAAAATKVSPVSAAVDDAPRKAEAIEGDARKDSAGTKPLVGLSALVPKREAAKPEADAGRSAGKEPETKQVRFDDIPRTRRIDRGPMPRLEDETPAALAAGEQPRGSGSRWLKSAGTVSAAAAAGLVAYFGVRLMMGPVADPSAGNPDQPVAAAGVAPAPSAAEGLAPAPVAEPEKEAASEVQVSFGAAPQDINLDADKGLLELNTGARHSIYVDNVFVGRGPRRRVPLGIGKHDVRLKLDGAEIKHEVEVRAGSTTNLSLAGGE